MRVAVDGYNMAMVHGTGVATYGVSLAQTLQSMGVEVDGVFGLDVGRDPDTRELLFFDNLGDGHRATESELRRSVAWQTLLNWRSVRLRDVPLSDHVEKRGFTARLPNFCWTLMLLISAEWGPKVRGNVGCQPTRRARV